MNIFRNIISHLSSPTKTMWVIYIISAAIIIPYKMAVDSWIRENPITYTVVDKNDGQIEAHTSKHAKNYSLVYYVRVKYDKGGYKSIAMEDPFVFKSYQMGATYTVPTRSIEHYDETGINVPWYMNCTIFFFVVVYVILFGGIGGGVMLIATAYEVSERKTFWSMDI